MCLESVSRKFALGALVPMLCLGAGCAAPPPAAPTGPASEITFPPPPETPRFVFERTLRSSLDVASAQTRRSWRQTLTGEQNSAQALAKPFDVAACGARVYVSDSVLRRVFVFDVGEQRFFEIGRDEPGRLLKPLGLATDHACNLYVADATLHQVLVYDRTGTHLRSVGGLDWFDRLSHVAVDAGGDEIYAVDTGGVDTDTHRVRVFDARTGAHLRDVGSRGRELGQLNLPRDAAIGPDGTLYVIDGGNFRVQAFDRAGQATATIGSIGRRYGQFSRPKGIAVDGDGNVYVSDAAHGNFQIFAPDGALLLFVGARSDRPGPASYMLPAGIDVDADGRVYLVDQYFQKVDVYRPAALAADSGALGERGSTPP